MKVFKIESDQDACYKEQTKNLAKASGLTYFSNSFSPFSFSEETDCCKTSDLQSGDCLVIPIPSADRFYSWINETAHCLNFVRSQPVCRHSI